MKHFYFPSVIQDKVGNMWPLGTETVEWICQRCVGSNTMLDAYSRILSDKCDLFLSSHIPRHGPLDSPEFGPDLENGLI